MDTPFIVPLVESLSSNRSLSATLLRRIAELRWKLDAATRSGLEPVQFSAAQDLVAMLDAARDVIDSLHQKPASRFKPFAGRGLPGTHFSS